MRYTTIDLFAGAGGLSLGLKAAGFEAVAAVERDPDAAASYRANVPCGETIEGDAREVAFHRFAGIDLVAGGPPCQPFSIGGLRRGRGDARDLLPEFVRAVREIRPRAFLMENVPGLVGEGHLAYLRETFAPLAGEYNFCGPYLLNAADYGVPQSRRRMFLVGVRDGIFRLPSGDLRRAVPAGAVLTAEPQGEPNASIVTYARKPDIRPSPYHGHLFNGGGRAIDLSQPAPTMLASAGGNKTHWLDLGGHVPTYHAHLIRGGAPRVGRLPDARRLTVAECAALQTFPAGMSFAGARSSQYTQVGNAVPVRLAQAIGEALAGHMAARSGLRRPRKASNADREPVFAQ